MDRKEHIEKHKKLHINLDELVADYMIHTKKLIASDSTIMDLMKWSYQQTLNPDEIKSE